MPYTPSTTIETNIVLNGDITGSVYNTRLYTLENVQTGTLPVSRGGTGINSILSGALLIGGNNSFAVLDGTEGGYLSYRSGSWKNISEPVLTDIELSSSNNFIEVEKKLDSTKINFVFNFKPQAQNCIFISPLSGGIPEFKPITSDVIPSSLYDKTIERSYFAGTANLQGNFSGSLSGDGANIKNISAENLTNLPGTIQQTLLTLNNLTASHLNLLSGVSTPYLSTNAGSITGSFSGDGGNLFNIQATNINNLDTVVKQQVSLNLTSSGIVPFKERIIDQLTAGPGINIANDGTISTSFDVPKDFYLSSSSTINVLENNGTSSFSINPNLSINYLNASLVAGTTISGNLTGDGSGIRNIPLSALESSYIEFNGQKIYLGQSLNFNGISDLVVNDQNLSSSVSLNGTSRTISLNLAPEMSIQSVFASEAMTSPVLLATSFVSSSQVIANEISSSGFVGDGSRLTNINFNLIDNLEEKIINSIKLKNNNINFENSFFGLNDNITLNSAILNNLSSSNINADNITVKNLITDNLIFTSSVQASYFVGNGSLLNNIDYYSLNNLPDLGIFVNKTDIEAELLNINNISAQNTTIVSDFLTAVSSSNILFATGSYDNQILTWKNNRWDVSDKGNLFKYQAQNYNIGEIVSLNNGSIVRADKASKINSKAIGIVAIVVNNYYIYVQDTGEIDYNLELFEIGEKIYLGINGQVCKYSDLLVGDYATQIGYKTTSGKLAIDIKTLWKVN